MKLMIVDDEAPIRDYIRHCVVQAGTDWTVEASVARAAQALEQLEKQPFDLILTDITMPNIDGLELLRTVRTRWPSTDVIILTCHDDFAFARTAVKEGAVDYVLKNEVTPENMRTLLTDLAEKRMHSRQERMMQGRFDIAQYMNGILKDDQIDLLEKDAWQRIFPQGMQTAFFALVFEYDKGAIDWIARQGPSWLRNQAMFSTPEGVLVLIAGLACEENACIQRENIQTLYNAMRARVDKAIGCSSVYHDPAYIKRAILEAAADRDRGFYQGPHEGQPVPEHEFSELYLARNHALLAFQAKDYAGLREQMRTIFTFARTHQVNVIRLKRVLSFLAEMIGEQQADLARELEQCIRDAPRLDELQEGFDRAIAQLEQTREASSANIAAALTFMHQHFRENVTLQDVAGAAFLNTEYFSRRFKKEMGVNYSEYLLKLRMEEAVRLLRTTDKRVGDIASEVGIPNVSYFTSVFKKQYGMTPNESRRK